MIKLEKIDYKKHTKHRETRNFHQIAVILADYGYDCIKLSDDSNGPDFIAYHIDGDNVLKIQQKSRLEINKKYGKDIYMAFPLHGEWYLILHEELVELVKTKADYLNTESWREKGIYNTEAPNEELCKALQQQFKLDKAAA